MQSGTVGSASIRIDADTAGAVAGLRRVSSELESLVPGGNAVASVFERIQGGALQLVQGMSRNIFQAISTSMTKVVSAGVDTAKTIEMAKVAFDNLLESGEDVDQLLLRIQEDATKTPFDVDALTLSTQKLALITKNGAQAEATVLALGQALAAAGRGTAEMNRMATNLQQIGQNAKATERDLREFGNAGVDIVGIVAEFSDEFKQTGLEVTKARDWLKTIDDPYTVITNALIKAGQSAEGFAGIYEGGAQTIGQALENMSDSIAVFGMRVMQQSGVLEKFKSVLKEFQQDLFQDHEFTANMALSIERLIDSIRELDVIKPIINGIKTAVSAFASGQFDNVIVFFKNLFNAIKQFSGLRVISNFFKVILDLFSDNHTAEEVAKVATQIGNLVRMFLELRMAMNIANYAYRVADAIMTISQGASILIPRILSLGASMGVMKATTLGLIGGLAALIGAIALFANVSGGTFTDVLDSVISGFKSFFETIGNAAKEMVSFGWNLIVGLYNGIVEGFNAVIGKIREMAQAIIDAFANVFQIHSPSRVMRDYIGRNIMEGIIEGIHDKYGDVVVAIEEVLEELVKLQADYVKEMNNFGALDLVEQVRVYKEFASLYAKGTRARLEMDEKVHDAESEITKEMIRLIEEFNKAFDKAYHKAKDYYDMFEYTQVTLTRTTKSVIEGLRRQNDNMEKYYKNIYAMSQMGFDDDFMAYVYEQGLDAASEVAGLSQATKEQIEEINEMWRTRGKIATDIAVLNTKKLKEETLDELGYLQTGLETKTLDYYDSGTYLMYNFARGIYDMIPSIEDAMARVTARASSSAKGAADDALSHISSEPLIPETEAVKDFTAAAKRMEVQMFDTADAFSFIKNLLGGIPWWGWALAAGGAIAGVLRRVGDVKSALQGTKQVAQTVGPALGGAFKRVTNEVYNFSGATEAANATFRQGANNASASFTKIADDAQGTYTRTVTETQKAAKQVNDITYSSATKTGENLLRPFKTFNTRVKGFFSTISNTINEMLNVIFEIVRNFVKQVMNVVSEFTGGLGKAIKALLKPLSDTKLLTGTAVLAALAGTLILLATAGLIFNQVEWESLGKMAVVTVALIAVAAVMQALGSQAELILAGALAVAAAGAAIGVATAAIGLGILTMVACFQNASEMASSINVAGFDVLKEALFKVGGMFLEIGILGGLWGAVAGVFSTMIGVEIFVVATTLAGASALASGINLEAFDMITAGLKAAGAVFLEIGILGGLFAAIAGIFSTMIGAELFAVALTLRLASELGIGINIDGIIHVGEAVKAANGVFLEMGVLGSAFGAIAGIFAALIGGEFLAIALALRGASELGGGIILDNLQNVGDGVKKANAIFLEIGLLGSIGGAIIGVFAALVGGEFLAIALALRGASELGAGINTDNLDNVGEAVKKANGVFLDIGALGAISGAIVGAFASMVSVEFMTITIALANASKAAKDINLSSIPYIGLAIKMLNAIDFGDFWENWGNANTSAKVKDVAQNVDSIVSALMDACTKIAELEKYSEKSVIGYMTHVTSIIRILTEMDFGAESANDDKKKASEKLSAVTENVDAIITTITDAVLKLADLTHKVGKNQIDLYMDHIKSILTKLSGFELTDDKSADDNGWFSQTKLDKTKQATSKIAELAEQISKIMDSVKNIVDILASLDKEGITPARVEGYVGNTKGIIDKFAGIEVSQTVEDSLKDNVAKIAEVSNSVSTIIGSAKSIVETLQALEKAEISPEKVAEYVGKANTIVAKFGELALEEKVDGAYEKLANNTSNLATATTKVNEILEQAKKMVDLVEQYEKAIEGKNVDIMVQQINKMLAQIAGGDAYADGENNWHQGIKLPDNMTFTENDTNILGQIKNALDHIKSIAETINSIPDTAEKIGGVKTIIDFIKETMSQLPETIGGFSEEFTGIGEKLANAFKTGWESSYPTLSQVGEEAQSKIWRAIEDKMDDEWHQGEWMATKFLEGWRSRINADAFEAGHAMQDGIWRGVEAHIADEWWQGQALSNSFVNGIWAKQGDWWWTGDNMVAGVAGGINRNMWQISQAAGNISQVAVNKLKTLLDIHSPSRVMAELGGFVAQGFAEGITDQLEDVQNAGEALAEAVMDGYNDAIEPLELSAYEARAVADQAAYGQGYASRSTSVVQNNNIYNNMDMSQALGQIAWEVSRS